MTTSKTNDTAFRLLVPITSNNRCTRLITAVLLSFKPKVMNYYIFVFFPSLHVLGVSDLSTPIFQSQDRAFPYSLSFFHLTYEITTLFFCFQKVRIANSQTPC